MVTCQSLRVSAPGSRSQLIARPEVPSKSTASHQSNALRKRHSVRYIGRHHQGHRPFIHELVATLFAPSGAASA